MLFSKCLFYTRRCVRYLTSNWPHSNSTNVTKSHPPLSSALGIMGSHCFCYEDIVSESIDSVCSYELVHSSCSVSQALSQAPQGQLSPCRPGQAGTPVVLRGRCARRERGQWLVQASLWGTAAWLWSVS